MATIGSALTSPETGWRRIDNTDVLINYIGDGFKHDNNHSTSYNKTLSYIPEGDVTPEEMLNHKIRFNFVGTKLRIMGIRYFQYTKELSVTVDGVEQIRDTSDSSSGVYQVLLFEFKDLENKVHNVEIKCLDGVRYGLDCIDIDTDGYLCDDRAFVENPNISHKNATLLYTLPMATTKEINAKTNDSREGLLGMANDVENYGDLYVVGKDGKAHLTKSGIKSEIIFDGVISTTSTPVSLTKDIKVFNKVIVYVRATNVSNTVTTRFSTIVDCAKVEYGYDHRYSSTFYATAESSAGCTFYFEENNIILSAQGNGSGYKKPEIYMVEGIY